MITRFSISLVILDIFGAFNSESEAGRERERERGGGKGAGRTRVKDGVCGCSEATSMRKRESDERKVERRDRRGESGGEREKCCVSPGQIRLGDVIKIGKMCLMNIHLCLDLRY